MFDCQDTISKDHDVEIQEIQIHSSLRNLQNLYNLSVINYCLRVASSTYLQRKYKASRFNKNTLDLSWFSWKSLKLASYSFRVFQMIVTLGAFLISTEWFISTCWFPKIISVLQANFLKLQMSTETSLNCIWQKFPCISAGWLFFTRTYKSFWTVWALNRPLVSILLVTLRKKSCTNWNYIYHMVLVLVFYSVSVRFILYTNKGALFSTLKQSRMFIRNIFYVIDALFYLLYLSWFW